MTCNSSWSCICSSAYCSHIQRHLCMCHSISDLKQCLSSTCYLIGHQSTVYQPMHRSLLAALCSCGWQQVVLHAGLTTSNHMWAAAAVVLVVLIAMAAVCGWRRSLPTQAAGIDLAVLPTSTSKLLMPCTLFYSCLMVCPIEPRHGAWPDTGHKGCEDHGIVTCYGGVHILFTCIVTRHTL